MENEEQNEQCQIILDPELENVEYTYEISKKDYFADSLISKGRLGPMSLFKKAKSDQYVAIKKISNVYENPSIGKNKTIINIIFCKSSKYNKIIRYCYS